MGSARIYQRVSDDIDDVTVRVTAICVCVTRVQARTRTSKHVGPVGIEKVVNTKFWLTRKTTSVNKNRPCRKATL